MPKPGQLTKYGVWLFLAFQGLLAAQLAFSVGHDNIPDAENALVVIVVVIGMILTAIFSPVILALNLAIFLDYCLPINLFGLYEEYGFLSPFFFNVTVLSVVSLLLLSTIDYLCVPDKTGVPRLYRFLAAFTRDPNPAGEDVRRATTSAGAPTFNAGRFTKRQEQPTRNAYDETLEREELEAALQEAEKAKQRLSEEEQRRQEREAQRRQAAKELAEKMEEVERLKARVDELKRKD